MRQATCLTIEVQINISMHRHPHKSQKDLLLWGSLSINEQWERFIFYFPLNRSDMFGLEKAMSNYFSWLRAWVSQEIIQVHVSGAGNMLTDVLNQIPKPLYSVAWAFQILNRISIYLFASIYLPCFQSWHSNVSAAPVKLYFLTSQKQPQFIFSDATASWDSRAVTVWWELVLSVVAEPERCCQDQTQCYLLPSPFQVISLAFILEMSHSKIT